MKLSWMFAISRWVNYLYMPYVKGDRLSITISEEEYQVGLEACKYTLH